MNHGLFIVVRMDSGQNIVEVCTSIDQCKKAIYRDISARFKVIQISLETLKPLWIIMYAYRDLDTGELVFEMQKLSSSPTNGPVIIEEDPIKIFALRILENDNMTIDMVKDILKL